MTNNLIIPRTIIGIFPPPGQPAVLRSEILQGMDPERAAQLVHELPPRPLRMNYPPMGGPGGMGGHFNNMGFGGFRNNHHHNNNGGPPGPNGVDHTVARQQRRLYCGNLPAGINEVTCRTFLACAFSVFSGLLLTNLLWMFLASIIVFAFIRNRWPTFSTRL